MYEGSREAVMEVLAEVWVVVDDILVVVWSGDALLIELLREMRAVARGNDTTALRSDCVLVSIDVGDVDMVLLFVEIF